MMDLTVDSLKQIASTVVAESKTSGQSLNDGIIKAASANLLNPEQIKRVVEASNQIAYLSKLAEADDRTMEFAVADYDTVIESFTTSVEGESMEKEASANRPSPLDLIAEPMEKQASEQPTEYSISTTQKQQLIQSEYMSGMQKLASMKIEEEALLADLQLAVGRLKGEEEPAFLVKAASVATGADYGALCNLVLGHVKEASEQSWNYSPTELSEVKSLHDLYTLSKEAVEKRKALEANLEKAATYLRDNVWTSENLEKQAFVGAALKGAKAFGSVIGKKAPGAVPGAKKVGGRVLKVGTAGMTGAEVAEISQHAKPSRDVWKSLHG